MIEITVRCEKRKDSDVCSLTEAMAVVSQMRAGSDSSEPVLVRVHPGTYREKVHVEQSDIAIVGAGAEECVIEWSDGARDLMPDGSGPRGTFRSYTMLVHGNHVRISGLTIRNAASPRAKRGQAIALYVDGDGVTVENCSLESHQDTLFTGPLPPAPIIPGSFKGPLEDAPRIQGHQLYRNCRICGDIDFIFGGAAAWFEKCTLISLDDELAPAVNGYVTAASTPRECRYGYVFHQCVFTGDVPDGSVYIGRPWRNYAKTVLIDCELGAHINEAGFHDWDKKEARASCYYAEYKSRGAGAGRRGRADFARLLTEEEAGEYTPENVLMMAGDSPTENAPGDSCEVRQDQ